MPSTIDGVNNNNNLFLRDSSLYGRDEEINTLLQALGNSMDGLQIVWIRGPSGVGKSKLVQHGFQGRKTFCSGKFDSFPSPKPYATIIKCLSNLCRILSHDDYPKVSVSPDVASVLTKRIPDISNVLLYENIESISSSQRLRISESQLDEWGFQKLKQAVKTFVKGACDILMSVSSLPLILYFDDLQWADMGSLEIFKFLLSDNDTWKGFLFVGSYRDDNLEKNDSLMGFFKTIIEECKGRITEISLGNLTREAVNGLVADVLSNQVSLSEQLTKVIFDITNGNAFHIATIMQFLSEKKDLQFSASSGSWTWNKGEDVLGIGVSSIDVVRLLFSRLSMEAVNLLKLASCFGVEVEICLLDNIRLEFNLNTKSESLEEVLKEIASHNLIEIDASKEFFLFLHDQIQFAAYSLIGSDEIRQSMHLRIGRCILSLEEKSIAHLPHGARLLAVDQLNRGRALIDTTEEKVTLAQLNISAAEELIAASAFVMAQDNLMIVIELLGPDRWNQYYDMAIASHLLLASAYFGNGSMEATLQHVNEILRESKNVEDRRKAQILHLEVLCCNSQVEECMDLSMKLLSELGQPKLPKNPGMIHVIGAFIRVKKFLNKMSHEDILNLPECNDTRILNISRIVGILGVVALFADKEALIPILVCQSIELYLKNGVNEYSSYPFSSFGFALTMTGDFDGAFRFGELAIQLMRRFHEDPKTFVMVYGVYYHIKRPLLDAINPTMHAYYLAFSHGDLTFAGQASATHIILRFVAGSSLNTIVDDIFSFCDQLKSFNQKMIWDFFVTMQRSCLELTDRNEEIVKLTGAIHDDESFEHFLEDSIASRGKYQLGLHTFQCRFYLGMMDSALKYAEVCWGSKATQGAYVLSTVYFFFSALTALEQWKKSNFTHRRRFWLIFRKNHRNLISWSDKGNPNTIHLVHILDAELLSTRKHAKANEVKAIYDKSISRASRAGYIHDAALANERAGEFFLNQGDVYWAHYYLGRAKSLFSDWGASAKVFQMATKYGSLVETELEENNVNLLVSGRSRQDMVDRVDNLRTRQSFVVCRSLTSTD